MSALHYIYFILLYSTVLVFAFSYKKLDPVLRILFYYLIVLAVTSSLAMFVRLQLNIRNNLFIYHFFTPVEYGLLALMFYRVFGGQLIRKAVLWSIGGFVLLSAVLSIWVEPLNQNNSYARSAEALLITFWALVYFRQLFVSERIVNLKREPFFWISIGLLFYFLGTLFLQGLLNYLIRHNMEQARRLYPFQYLYEYILFVLINLALFCRSLFPVRDEFVETPGISSSRS